jgi:hypothetical protein
MRCNVIGMKIGGVLALVDSEVVGESKRGR